MRSFSCTVHCENGIHARPAGLLAKTVKGFHADIIAHVGERRGNVKSIISVMAMDIRCGEDIVFEADGEDEDLAIDALKQVAETVCSA